MVLNGVGGSVSEVEEDGGGGGGGQTGERHATEVRWVQRFGARREGEKAFRDKDRWRAPPLSRLLNFYRISISLKILVWHEIYE